MRTVCSKMSTFLACVLFLVLVLGELCAEKYYQAPRKESSTTFLRLTALRSDEGLWTARFADYEITIELKHHPNPKTDTDCNDTWTLKIKHTPKRFMLQDEPGESKGNEVDGEITQEPYLQSSDTRGTWKQIIESIDENHEDPAMFKKIHSPTIKSKRAKARRQLSTKAFTSTTEKSDINLGGTAYAYSNDPVIMKELAQGSNRLNVIFDKNDKKKKPVDKFDAAYEEDNEKPWRHIAAVIYDGMSTNSTFINNETDNTPDAENHNIHVLERLADAFALPFQSSQTDDYEESLGTSLGEDIASPQDSNPDTWEIPKDVVIDVLQTSRNNSDETVTSVENDDNSLDTGTITPQSFNPEPVITPEDGVVEENPEQVSGKGSEEANSSNNDEANGNEEDYVIEDTLAERYDSDEDGGMGSEVQSSEIDFSEMEVPPEMQRIMEWYPRSKPLSFQNNGYKLFPEVGWFKFVPWAERWSNARKACESENAHLAIPDSKQKVRIFLQIFKNFPDVLEQSILNQQVYVGVYSRGLHRNLTTVQGQPFQPQFPIWFPGEPDNADPGEDCVTFHAEGKIRDVPCFYNLPFLCEKEPDIS